MSEDRVQLRERIAKRIYELNPCIEGGEYVDGFQVSRMESYLGTTQNPVMQSSALNIVHRLQKMLMLRPISRWKSS